jgi:hypothetical protein
MRSEALAAALGIAPPTALLASPLGHPLSVVPVPNDRPSVSVQASIPLTWYVRSDFFAGVKSALSILHAQGAALPMYSPIIYLPAPSPTFLPPADWLSYLAREVQVFPPAALADPTSDAVALVSSVSGGPYVIACSASGILAPPPAPWYALEFGAGAVATEVALASASFIPIASILAS